MERTPDFETNDMGLAAYLVLSGLECTKTEWRKDTRWTYWLFFDNTDRCALLLEQWLDRTSQVEPRRYNDVYAMLKRGLNSSRPEGMPQPWRSPSRS